VPLARATPAIEWLRWSSIVLIILLFGIGTAFICNENRQLHQPPITTPLGHATRNIHQAKFILLPSQQKTFFSGMPPSTIFGHFPQTIQTQTDIGSDNNANVLSTKPLPASQTDGLTMNGMAPLF
jgi:hypothetical protein